LSDLIKKDGFNFAFKPSVCSICQGNCCIGEKGYIWIDMSEIEDLAKRSTILSPWDLQINNFIA